MQQKLMSVRVRCVAADSIYANNANRKFCTKYGISISFVRKGRAAKDEQLRKNKGAEQEDGNPVDLLRNTYGKCRTDDRQDQKQTG